MKLRAFGWLIDISWSVPKGGWIVEGFPLPWWARLLRIKGIIIHHDDERHRRFKFDLTEYRLDEPMELRDVSGASAATATGYTGLNASCKPSCL